MPDTGFWVGADRKDMLATNYVATAKDPTLEAADPAYMLSTYDHPGTYYSAGGGLVSTAMDYLRFCQMLLNGGEIDGVRVLRPETVKMMLSRQTTPEQGLVFSYLPDQGANAGYAWGLSIGVRVADTPHAVPGSLGDVQWSGLANTTFFIDPKEQLIAVAMAQYEGPDEEALVVRLRDGVYGALTDRAAP
jgi:CubicO group peptidase (beta-lactamase class C family)